MRLANQVALITGAGGGIGRATALLMAQEGAAVMLADTNSAGGEETVRLIENEGGKAAFMTCDVTRAPEIHALCDAAVQTFGQLTLAVNNAGVGGTLALTVDQTEEMWDAVINVNLKGVWLCMKYQIPHMLAAGGGAIVNVASLAGLIGFPFGQIYAASKHGVLGLTKSTALEYARKGIRVNAVCPGFTDTPMVSAMAQEAPRRLEASVGANPMRRLGTPEETAAAIVWLCTSEASFVNGHALSIDGGAAVM